MSPKYADIIIDISHEAIDRAFQYEVPDFLREELKIGMQVKIPFGKGNAVRKGYVVGFSNEASYDPEKLKQIIEIENNSVKMEGELISLAAWMKENYGSTMYQSLKTVMPVKEKVKRIEKKTIHLLLNQEALLEVEAAYEKRRSKAKLRLLRELMEEPYLPYELVSQKLHISAATLNGMVADKTIEILKEQVYREPFAGKHEITSPITLNQEQQKCIDIFTEDYKKGNANTYLLYGVTGSGKTEVYMEMIDQVVKSGKQAIVLIPEISLTYQTVKRFLRRFHRVTIMNSKLSKGERYDQFLRAKNGEVDIVIGPRSALFMPFANLGLIIMDEEHESSYKNEYPPKYHARELAIWRAAQAGASVVLGSATPSVESYTNAMLGKYKLLKLTNRAVNSAKLPQVQVVDLREELKQGNRSIFSISLQKAMEEALAKGEQIMLFMNRRGYESFVSCRSCGKVVKCPHCDVSLTKHKNNKLICHYCGHEERNPSLCPFCSSKFIAGFHTGTEKIEEEVKKMFPNAVTLRMDMDTTKTKGGHEEILSKFENGDADILVGTQMIVKGHDFKKVTLVGIIAADLSLYSNDYRASERTFDLLTQAAGRAGRGEMPGTVIIQTYNPEHYSVVAASRQNYEEFYQQEIAYRRILKYPPVYQMLVVFITSKWEETAYKASNEIAEFAKENNQEREYYIVGASDATLSKINDIYRRVVYMKHLEYNKLVEMKNKIEEWEETKDWNEKVTIQFDFNPMGIY